MPVQPDPTHPKFLEGDDVLPATEDDVQGHLRAAVTEEPVSEPEGQKTRNINDVEGDDVEGHLRSF